MRDLSDEKRMDMVFSAEKISAYLGNTEMNIISFGTIDSTNTKARLLLEENPPLPFLVTADEQTAGRGRRGNFFYSPAGGFYYTLVIKADNETDVIAKATIAAAVSLLEAIRETTGIACGIKWVNDLYYNNRKIAGILCEAPRGSDGSLKGIIIGIGVNLANQPFPDELKDKAGSLGLCNADKNLLAAKLTERLLYWCSHIESTELIRFYKEHSILLGKEVSFADESRTVTGTAVDINNAGNLVVRAEKKEYTLSSGEVSLLSW